MGLPRITSLIIRCFFICSISASCTHVEKRFANSIASADCDGALKNVPDYHVTIRTAKEAEYLAKNMLSYSYTASGYTVEVLWDTSATAITVVALCGGVIALASQASAAQGIGFICAIAPGVAKSYLFSPPLGRYAWNQTRHLRCPDLTSLSRSLTKVAQCYENKNTADDLERAIATLNSIENSHGFFDCLPESEKNNVLEYQKLLSSRR